MNLASARRLLSTSRPRLGGELGRQLRVALNEQEAAKETLRQLETEARALGGTATEMFLEGSGEKFDQLRDDIEGKVVAARREVERWDAIVEGVRERAIDAVAEANDAAVDAVVAERATLERERERLLAQIHKLDRRDAGLAAEQAAIEQERLPLLAQFDEAAAEQLAAREKARQDEAVQLAHQRLRGENPVVPEELEALVRKQEPLIRAGQAERRRDQAEHFKRIGTVPVKQYTYDDFDAAGARRDPNLDLGFTDPEV
jgi:hypothetical protein